MNTLQVRPRRDSRDTEMMKTLNIPFRRFDDLSNTVLARGSRTITDEAAEQKI